MTTPPGFQTGHRYSASTPSGFNEGKAPESGTPAPRPDEQKGPSNQGASAHRTFWSGSSSQQHTYGSVSASVPIVPSATVQTTTTVTTTTYTAPVQPPAPQQAPTGSQPSTAPSSGSGRVPVGTQQGQRRHL